MDERRPKEVSTLELFYDLIFAYAISKMTAVLHVIDHHTIAAVSVLEFCMMVLVFWTIWTYQTVFANRFYENTVANAVFLLIDMFLVVVLSQSLNRDFYATQPSFAGMTALLFISLGLQYFYQMHKTHEAARRQVARNMGSAALVIGLWELLTVPYWPAPYAVQFGVYAVSIFAAGFGPLGFSRRLQAAPTSFEHLTERYQLFTILLFGEAVIGVASTVAVHEFKLTSIPFFVVIALLYLWYDLTYRFAIDRHRKTAGLVLIHMHYFLFLVIPMMTVLLELYLEGELATSYLVAGISVSLLIFAACLAWEVWAYRRRQVTWGSTVRPLITVFVIWLAYAWLSRAYPLALMLGLVGMLLSDLFFWWRLVQPKENLKTRK